MKKLRLLLFCQLLSLTAWAQSASTPPIALMARGYADRVVLRYAPASSILFNKGNTLGYDVERAKLVKGLALANLAWKAVKGSPFRRWNDAEWEAAYLRAQATDTTAANNIGLAMAFSGTAKLNPADVLADGLTSLRLQQENAEMRFGFALIAANRNAIAAEGLALRVADTEVVPGETYVYRVRIHDPEYPAFVYVQVTCGSFNGNLLRNDKGITLTEGDGSVRFAFPESSAYYAFRVERADQGIVTNLTKTPELQLKPKGAASQPGFVFADSGLTNYKKYTYRVLAVTPFADELLLAQFDAVPRDRTPPRQPMLRSATHVRAATVELKWEMRETPGDLKGFTVKRGRSENGAFVAIASGLPASARTYTDLLFDKNGQNYYLVEALDTAGNFSRSYPIYVALTDSVPPAMPMVSSAKIDTSGKVIIRIKPAAENDFMGYQLLKSNSPEHEFSVISETFADSLEAKTFVLYDSTTLNTLTKKIYYQVIAFDTHFNQSTPSKIIELTRRDTIPPVSPIITGFSVNDSTIVIEFANSGSEDAERSMLLRRETGKTRFDTIFSNTNRSIVQFRDRNANPGQEYEYAMLARDQGGLKSPLSRSIVVKALPARRLSPPVIRGTYDGKSGKVTLFFQVDDKLAGRKLTVELLRKNADAGAAWSDPRKIAFVKGAAVTDEPLAGQPTVSYVARIVDERRNASIFSAELQLVISQ